MFGQTWSIVIEFQFYLIFPFLTLVLARDGIQRIVLLVIVLILLRAALWGLDHDVNHLGYWTLLGRGDQFLIGMLAGYAYRNWRMPFVGGSLSLLASIVMIAISVQYFHEIYGSAHPWEDKPMMHWFSIIWPDVQALAFAWFILAFLKWT
ncbi:hypothetical protein HGG75_10640 [Ochrobactrum pseudogrignonense]|nr:hypothetical protein [Brucella pseudogrignonensis]